MARLGTSLASDMPNQCGWPKPSKMGLIPVPDQSETAEARIGLQPNSAGDVRLTGNEVSNGHAGRQNAPIADSALDSRGALE